MQYRKKHKLQQCNICEQGETGKANVLLSCAYCNNNTHKNCDDRPLTEEQKTWNTYKQCPHCEETHKHPTVREEERITKVNKAEDEIWEYNEQHSDTCCRCQVKLKSGEGENEANHMLSCASFMRSVHEQDVQKKQNQCTDNTGNVGNAEHHKKQSTQRTGPYNNKPLKTYIKRKKQI